MADALSRQGQKGPAGAEAQQGQTDSHKGEMVELGDREEAGQVDFKGEGCRREQEETGIAAPQVGVPLRIATIEVTHNPRYPYKPPIPLTVVVNPVVEPLDDETVEINEGCLSVADFSAEVRRHAKVCVSGLDREGKPITIEAEGLKAVVAGVNPIDMKRGMDQAVEQIVAKLKGMAVECKNKKSISQVGTVAANGDEEIGNILADAMEQVGKDGVITVEEGKSLTTNFEFV